MHHQHRTRKSARICDIERLEARVVPVTSLLSNGLWTIALDSPQSIALQPDAQQQGRLVVVAQGNVVAESSVPISEIRQIQILGSNGADTIDASALTRSMFVTMPSLSIQSGNGNDTVLGGSGLPTLVDAGDGDDSVRGFFGDDTFIGGAGNDVLDGSSGRDVLRGLAGNDSLIGQSGDDLLIGGAGRDSLLGGLGNDVAQGQGGSGDFVDGGPGNDTLSGGEGNDILRGAAGDDVLDGQQNDDVLSGDGGHDLLLGSVGNDTLSGSAGRDLLIGGDGRDDVHGGDDEDIVIGATTSLLLPDLQAMHRQWLQTQTYRLRVAALMEAATSRSFVVGATVSEDFQIDDLHGDAGRDWFLHSLDSTEVAGQFVYQDDVDKTRSEATNAFVPIAHSEVRSASHSNHAAEELLGTPTRRAIASGNWSDATVWEDGLLPVADDVVTIDEGITITVDDVFTQRLAGVLVSGALTFATDRTTQLTVDTLLVTESGRFEMGSSAQPIATDVTATLLIADRGPIDRSHDVFALGRGLLAESTVSMHGAPRTSFALLNGPAWSNSTRLKLQGGVPANWRIGDQLVLAGTNSNAEEDEQLVLLGIEGDAVVVRPLLYSHSFPTTTRTLDRPMNLHLANLTRNVVVRSESTAIDRRGHVMMLHHDDVDIEYAAFLDLGRTDKHVPVNDVLFDERGEIIPGTGTNPRGRYALHFHRGGTINDGRAARVHGSVVANSPSWGFTNHSSFVNFTDNVSYNIDGAGFVTEAGDEIGSFVGNLAIRGHGSGEDYKSRFEIQDFAHQGDGFWFQGGGVTVENNAAAGMKGSGLILYARALVEWDLQDDNAAFDQGTLFRATNLEFPEVARDANSAEVYDVPVRHFRNNEAYASEVGIDLDYFNYRPDTDFVRPRHNVRSVVENLTVWNSRLGAVVAYVSQTDIRNLTVIGRVSRPTGYGIKAHIKSAGVTFENAHVEGYLYGLTMPRRGVNAVLGGYFNNIDNITNLSMQQTLSDGTVVGFPTLENTLQDIEFGTLTAAALRGTIQRNVVITSWNLSNKGSFDNVFQPMIITLDFGGFENQRAYFALQSPDAIVFPALVPDLNPAWVGKTNQQLHDEFGLSFGDAIAPGVFASSDQVFADIGPLTDRLGRLATSQPALIAVP